MMENIIDNNIPTNPSWWQLIGKLVVGLITGLIFSAIVFVMFILLGSTIDEAIKNSANNLTFSPLVWLSFMAIGIITSILWNLVISAIYNVVWWDDYYDMKLMSSWILSANLLLFIPFLFLYFYVWTILKDIEKLFIVFGFHLFFSVFISLVNIDLIKNPNYSPVYIIWNSFGFIVTLLIFFIIFNVSTKVWDLKKNILFYPPILSFSLIPFLSALWEKIYYKFYEMWNDFLYVPSISEVLVDEEEIDEVNVEIEV